MPPFLHFTVATKYDENLNILSTLSTHFGLPTIVLGRDCKTLQSWGDFNAKIRLYREALKTVVNPETIVLLADAFDFLTLAPPEEIVTKFLAMDCDVLYNAEVFTHPDGERFKEYFELLPENIPKRYKYLNSGGIIGRAGKLLKLYDRYDYAFERDDQRYHTTAFLDTLRRKDKTTRMKLDVDNQIFACLAGSMSDLEFDETSGKFKMISNGSSPCLLHFNGQYGDTRPSFEKWNAKHGAKITRW